MILHIPHSSTDTLGKEFLCDIDIELERMTDIYTDKLFDYPGATKIVFSVSRLICDVERFEDDSMEEMASKGMGVCYITNSFGEPLRNVLEAERSEIIEKYYRPHHKALTGAVEKEVQIKGKALVVDCHSFSNEPLPHEDDKTTPRPDICIGTDDLHTPKKLIDEAVEYFESCNYKVSINSPFAGTLIPMDYYQKNNNVEGIMIEVNRDLYNNDIKFESVKFNIEVFLFKLLRPEIYRNLVIRDILKNGVKDHSIYEIFSFDDVNNIRPENSIWVFELEMLDFDYSLTDEALISDGYCDENDVVTNDMRTEYGMYLLEQAIEKEIEDYDISELIHTYKTVVIDNKKYLVSYDIQYRNYGMGGELDYENVELVGVFSSFQELRNYYENNANIIISEECDEKCIKKKEKYILDNWED